MFDLNSDENEDWKLFTVHQICTMEEFLKKKRTKSCDFFRKGAYNL